MANIWSEVECLSYGTAKVWDILHLRNSGGPIVGTETKDALKCISNASVTTQQDIDAAIGKYFESVLLNLATAEAWTINRWRQAATLNWGSVQSNTTSNGLAMRVDFELLEPVAAYRLRNIMNVVSRTNNTIFWRTKQTRVSGQALLTKDYLVVDAAAGVASTAFDLTGVVDDYVAGTFTGTYIYGSEAYRVSGNGGLIFQPGVGAANLAPGYNFMVEPRNEDMSPPRAITLNQAYTVRDLPANPGVYPPVGSPDNVVDTYISTYAVGTDFAAGARHSFLYRYRIATWGINSLNYCRKTVGNLLSPDYQTMGSPRNERSRGNGGGARGPIAGALETKYVEYVRYFNTLNMAGANTRWIAQVSADIEDCNSESAAQHLEDTAFVDNDNPNAFADQIIMEVLMSIRSAVVAAYRLQI